MMEINNADQPKPGENEFQVLLATLPLSHSRQSDSGIPDSAPALSVNGRELLLSTHKSETRLLPLLQ